MSNNSYESLNNDKDESSGDDASFTVRRKDKSSLRIRLNRVFSTGALKSPKSPGACSSHSNSRGSSPGRGSPSSKSRYSWQTSTLAGKDNRSPQRSPRCGTPTKGSPIRSSTAGSPASPATPKSPQNAATWYYEARMKYSPQQQQKERKSESDSLTLTPSRDLECRTKTTTTTMSSSNRQDSSTTSTNSRFSICRSGNSTGIFAWMRVFRFASMLHQIGC